MTVLTFTDWLLVFFVVLPVVSVATALWVLLGRLIFGLTASSFRSLRRELRK